VARIDASPSRREQVAPRGTASSCCQSTARGGDSFRGTSEADPQSKHCIQSHRWHLHDSTFGAVCLSVLLLDVAGLAPSVRTHGLILANANGGCVPIRRGGAMAAARLAVPRGDRSVTCCCRVVTSLGYCCDRTGLSYLAYERNQRQTRLIGGTDAETSATGQWAI
jgi:hypothetical protein